MLALFAFILFWAGLASLFLPATIVALGFFGLMVGWAALGLALLQDKERRVRRRERRAVRRRSAATPKMVVLTPGARSLRPHVALTPGARSLRPHVATIHVVDLTDETHDEPLSSGQEPS